MYCALSDFSNRKMRVVGSLRMLPNLNWPAGCPGLAVLTDFDAAGFDHAVGDVLVLAWQVGDPGCVYFSAQVNAYFVRMIRMTFSPHFSR